MSMRRGELASFPDIEVLVLRRSDVFLIALAMVALMAAAIIIDVLAGPGLLMASGVGGDGVVVPLPDRALYPMAGGVVAVLVQMAPEQRLCCGIGTASHRGQPDLGLSPAALP